MKKALLQKICNFLFKIVLCGGLFILTACGLDTYEVIDSPEVTVYSPSPDSPVFYNESYFTFMTNEGNSSSYSTVKFLGTQIYYKIYNNKTTMENETGILETLSEDMDTAASAPTKLMNTYSYQPLFRSDEQNGVTIPATGSDQEVYIRLTNYLDSARIEIIDGEIDGTKWIYKARIEIDGTEVCAPLRCFDSLTFDFGRSGDYDKVPVSGDEDVKFSSTTTTEDWWYVPLFAVGVAMDVSYSYQYSNILYLGYVIIDSSSEDN